MSIAGQVFNMTIQGGAVIMGNKEQRKCCKKAVEAERTRILGVVAKGSQELIDQIAATIKVGLATPYGFTQAGWERTCRSMAIDIVNEIVNPAIKGAIEEGK